MSRRNRVLAVAAATLGPAIGVAALMRGADPPQHDLSDIATGLIQLVVTAVAGALGLVTALAATRRRNRP